MSDLVGHKKVKKYFKNLIDQDLLGHAYIFHGSEMIGKRTFAMDLYALINRGSRIQSDPDLFILSSNIKEDDEKREEEEEVSDVIKISSIRQLKSFFSLSPYLGPYRMAIIDDAHKMNSEASNALLKVLEEPPKNAILILITSKPSFLPRTIQSRCEKVRFGSLNNEEILELLNNQKIIKEDKDFIIKISNGRPGMAKFLSDQDNLKLAKDSVSNLRNLLKGSISDRMKYAGDLSGSNNYEQTLSYWLDWVYASLRASDKNYLMVKKLLNLVNANSQIGVNKRLSLENFLINI